MINITAAAFLESFANEWRVAQAGNNVLRRDPYSGRREWTGAMLSGDGGLLTNVMERLATEHIPLLYQSEKYAIDAQFVAASINSHSLYPLVLIEHELMDRVEEEMWKLLQRRAPLKVLIFYDNSEQLKRKRVEANNWLRRKLEQLAGMATAADDFYGDETSAQYLFLIGGRMTEGGPIHAWRYATVENLEPVALAR